MPRHALADTKLIPVGFTAEHSALHVTAHVFACLTYLLKSLAYGVIRYHCCIRDYVLQRCDRIRYDTVRCYHVLGLRSGDFWELKSTRPAYYTIYWTLVVNPLRTAVPCRGHTTYKLSVLSPKRDCGSKRVKGPTWLCLRPIELPQP